MTGFDALPTPDWVTRRSMEWVYNGLYLPGDETPMRILDPGAGWGVWGRAARAVFPSASIYGIDIRNTGNQHIDDGGVYSSWIWANYLTLPVYKIAQFPLIIGNPPYSKAQEFIEKSLSLLAPDSYLIQFLRLGFAGSQKRASFFRSFPPYHIRIFSKRPSFTGNGKTDRGQEYALFVWKSAKGGGGVTSSHRNGSLITEFSWETGGDYD